LQLSRQSRPLPTMHLDPAVTSIFDFTTDSFRLEDYDAWPSIVAKVAV
jgi:thymidylate synthase